MVEPPSLFGLDLNPILRPRQYLSFVLVVFAILAVVVASIRRSALGRQLIAVRGNERAAAAVRINSVTRKLIAFPLASSFAACGGALIAFRTTSSRCTGFDAFSSITAASWAVIGGVGYIGGPLLGSTFTSARLGAAIAALLGDGAAHYVSPVEPTTYRWSGAWCRS